MQLGFGEISQFDEEGQGRSPVLQPTSPRTVAVEKPRPAPPPARARLMSPLGWGSIIPHSMSVSLAL